jgi:hypothetical protein
VYLQVTVCYPSQDKTRNVSEPDKLKICRALVDDKPGDIVNAVLKSTWGKTLALKSLCSIISSEALLLCTTSSNNISYLRLKDSNNLIHFSWEKFGFELETRAPNLLCAIQAVSGSTDPTPDVLFAAACALHARNRELSAAHHIVGLLLDEGGCKDKVSVHAYYLF